MIFISVFYYFICYYVLKFKFEFKCYYSIMASRNRRHQIPPTSDSTPGTGNNQVRNSIARELNRHNIVYNKTDKKTKLIQLCRDNGVLMGHQPGEQESHDINTGDNMLVSLTKTVAELQKTVLNTSGTVNKLVPGFSPTQDFASVTPKTVHWTRKNK